jgi:NitT/TauT family transport system substrate-binding protein
MKKIIPMAIALIALVVGYLYLKPQPVKPTISVQPAVPAVVTKVSVRLPWIRAYGEAGTELAVDQGYFKELGLDVAINPGSVENSPIRKVLTGEDTFGILEPSQIIVAVAKQDAPLVILAVKAQRSPMCMMSRTSANIKTVADFVGKKVGYNPLFDTGYLAMLSKNSVDRSKIKEVRAGFSIDPFLQGEADLWPVYLMNEPNAARDKGVEVSLVCADDAGVKLYEHAIFARKDYVAKNPEVVEAFLKGFTRGWLETAKNTDKAAEILVKRVPDANLVGEKRSLAGFVPLLLADKAKTDGFAWVDAPMMDELAGTLKGLGLIDKTPDSANYVDNSFLKKFDRKVP